MTNKKNLFIILGILLLCCFFFFYDRSPPNPIPSDSLALELKQKLHRIQSHQQHLLPDPIAPDSSSSSSSDAEQAHPLPSNVSLLRQSQKKDAFLPLRSIRGAPSKTHLHGDLVGKHLDGTPGWNPTPYLPASKETPEQKAIAHTTNCFNLFRSDSLPLDRPIPDVLPEKCHHVRYPPLSVLPSTSVVFVFFNEPLSPLLRSVHSVLDRSPPELLHEIILVDDGSDAAWLKQPLEDYLQLLPSKVRLLRLGNRTGLMTARTRGAQIATGETLTFLDSHIECSPRWLEPLMHRIYEDPKHVVMPVIDAIDADTFVVTSGGIDILGFSWSMGQQGIFGGKNRADDGVTPRSSPIMAGGLFSMDRALFWRLGGYDPEMREYGGEEFDISFRIWQCGSTLENVPCAHVGHIFRSKRYWEGQAYPVDGKNVIRNKLRTAEVWMDEYAQFPRMILTKLTREELGPLDELKALRRRLGCRPFRWYLDNVYPELQVPEIVQRGELRSGESGACLDTMGATSSGGKVGAYPCHGQAGTQFFTMDAEGHLQVPLTNFQLCVNLLTSGGLGLGHCGNEKWRFAGEQLVAAKSGKCLAVAREATPLSPFSLLLSPCDEASPLQKWKFL